VSGGGWESCAEAPRWKKRERKQKRPPQKAAATMATQEKSGSARAKKRRVGSDSPCASGELLHAVVGGFLGDDHVVDVGFTEAGGGDADEVALFGEFGDGARAYVTHTAFEAAD
jgi:hypothetical protein